MASLMQFRTGWSRPNPEVVATTPDDLSIFPSFDSLTLHSTVLFVSPASHHASSTFKNQVNSKTTEYQRKYISFSPPTKKNLIPTLQDELRFRLDQRFCFTTDFFSRPTYIYKVEELTSLSRKGLAFLNCVTVRISKKSLLPPVLLPTFFYFQTTLGNNFSNLLQIEHQILTTRAKIRLSPYVENIFSWADEYRSNPGFLCERRKICQTLKKN